jgi:hypothetical protein
MSETQKPEDGISSAESEARRDFLKSAGKFAAVTPPAVTFLLGTTLGSQAIAASAGTKPGHGWGDKNHTHVHKRRAKLRWKGKGPTPTVHRVSATQKKAK